ncbi:MAG: hypothetical protein E6J42_04895 [Chloroflexi bacterium]|nr:MAG: hypothetical protein E6J42_04895 [Chloroflexota bacterium]
MQVRGIRVLWIVLALLAVFVIFIEFIANVGGSDEPLAVPQPTRQAQPAATRQLAGDSLIGPTSLRLIDV